MGNGPTYGLSGYNFNITGTLTLSFLAAYSYFKLKLPEAAGGSGHTSRYLRRRNRQNNPKSGIM
jgi:hypothetical protein